ncbi:hypothetical protein B0G52_13431 [Cohnella sp. SGD-V74]|uniref:hypothetical protein n=1 Tax=unclassified Cohnella TaxID=2636738 RepID=UPI000D43032D|nr:MULTISPECIES: hypothetical protein [unclassified Cohnella]PRX58800.1 hypothetical protein B0G52_13431 [Cohnella sp. SGD-V74]
MLTKYSDFKEKDLEILRFVLKQGIVTSQQILRYTGETSLHNVYRRLRKLEAAGLVWKKKLTLRLNVYFPKREARDYLDYPVTVANDTSLYTAEHDLIINDLILHLKASVKAEGFDYKTEREYRFELLEDTEGKQEMLQKWNKIRDTLPDVVLLLPGFTIAVEAELHTKSNGRLQKKMHRYAAELVAGKYTDVWYFVPNQTIGNALKRAIEHVAQEWRSVGRPAQTQSGKTVFQQIQVRSLPAEVVGE